MIALGFVRKDEIDYERARNATKDEGGQPKLQGLLALIKNRQLLWFACGAALFQLADASMLPLAVEAIGRGQSQQGSLLASGLIVAPQVVVALLAPWVGYVSELWGRKPVLIVSFGVQIARAVLMGCISSSVLRIPVQLLDGVSGAIRTVLTVVIVADLTTGTGRFNLARGAIGLVVAVAASVSTLAFGYVAQEMSHWGAFLSMGGRGCSGRARRLVVPRRDQAGQIPRLRTWSRGT